MQQITHIHITLHMAAELVFIMTCTQQLFWW